MRQTGTCDLSGVPNRQRWRNTGLAPDTVNPTRLPSTPGEFHPEPLTQPDVNLTSPNPISTLLQRFACARLSLIESRNVAIDYRWAGAAAQLDRVAAMAEDLVSRNVAVIFCGGNDPATCAAMAATRVIPNRLHVRWRSRATRVCCGPQPAGRQRHGDHPLCPRTAAEAAGVAARARAISVVAVSALFCAGFEWF